MTVRRGRPLQDVKTDNAEDGDWQVSVLRELKLIRMQLQLMSEVDLDGDETDDNT